MSNPVDRQPMRGNSQSPKTSHTNLYVKDEPTVMPLFLPFPGGWNASNSPLFHFPAPHFHLRGLSLVLLLQSLHFVLDILLVFPANFQSRCALSGEPHL